jgi:hypothetical protein
MNAMEVIITARKWSFAQSSAAFPMLKPRSRQSLANSMITMAFCLRRDLSHSGERGAGGDARQRLAAQKGGQ